MSNADRLLDTLESGTPTAGAGSNEEHIVIGMDRVITVPESLRKIAIQYDHNIETVTFDCPRYWDECDLSKMQLYINYLRPDGEMGAAAIDSKTIVVNEDMKIMSFDWTIGGHITQVNGFITFLVCAKQTDDKCNLTVHWNTELNKDLYIGEGLEVNDFEDEVVKDKITWLLLRMDELEAISLLHVVDTQINGTSIVEGGVANIPYGSSNSVGVLKTDSGLGTQPGPNGSIAICAASKNEIANRGSAYKPIVPNTVDYAVKVGLTTNTETLSDTEKEAACEWLGAVNTAGEDQAYGAVYGYTWSSNNQKVIPYSPVPKASSLAMYNGSSGVFTLRTDTPVDDKDCANKKFVEDAITKVQISGGGVDVQINGTSIVEDGVANIPIASHDKVGVLKIGGVSYGLYIGANGVLTLSPASQSDIAEKTNTYKPLSPKHLDYAVKVGLTTNTETLSDTEKEAACEWLGAVNKSIVSDAVAGNTIPIRDANGKIFASPPTHNNHVATKYYVDDGFVGKIPNKAGVYVQYADGTVVIQTKASGEAKPWSMVERGTDGIIYTGTPTEAKHATTKEYVDTAVTRYRHNINISTTGGTIHLEVQLKSSTLIDSAETLVEAVNNEYTLLPGYITLNAGAKSQGMLDIAENTMYYGNAFQYAIPSGSTYTDTVTEI